MPGSSAPQENRECTPAPDAAEDGLSRHSIQFERIERWKDVRRKLADATASHGHTMKYASSIIHPVK